MKCIEIYQCDVCGTQLDSSSVLDLGSHPLCDDLVPIGDLRTCDTYPIVVNFCNVCKTAHQKFQVPKTHLFKNSYHYRARFTADVLDGMSDLVRSCEEKFGEIDGKFILDIGCNDGSLLSFFQKKGARTLGVEPTDACEDAQAAGHIVIKDFFSSEVAEKIVSTYGKPDYITFTNVFAHIENLQAVLAAIKVLIGDTSVLIIENHYLGSVLSGNQFDTFYHEHPRTYSVTSFKYVAEMLGLSLLDLEFPARYGGNIRVFMGREAFQKMSNYDLNELPFDESQFLTSFKKLAKDIDYWQIEKKAYLLDLKQRYGKLRAKAFPGRAAILIKLLALDESIFEAIYEKPGSLKIGNYVPGTKIPIVSDTELDPTVATDGPLINMAWHIPNEIREYLNRIGYQGTVEDILSQNYFR